MTIVRDEKNRILSFEERLDPASAALVVIDVQNDFVLPQGVCGQVGDDVSPVAPMLERLKALIESARKSGVLIVFVRATYDEVVLSPALAEQYRRRGYPDSICLSGTNGAEFYNGFEPQNASNEIVVTKHRYSPFSSSSIDLVLRVNGIRTLVLTGVATEVCVESTARDAFFKDYQVVVPEDCVGCYSEDRQKATLVVLARSFGAVTSSAEIQAVWQRLGNGPRNWQPASRASRALATLTDQLRPIHTALVLLNVQPEFFEAGGGCDGETQLNTHLVEILPRMRQLLADARQAGCFIIHSPANYARKLQSANLPSSPVLSRWRREDGPHARFMEGFEPITPEQVVTCHRFSSFADTQIDLLLRSNGIRTVVVAGATTNCAVESTVRDAVDRDYYTIVASDCVASPDSEMDLHSASLANMRKYFAAVISADEVASRWQAAAAIERAEGPIANR